MKHKKCVITSTRKTAPITCMDCHLFHFILIVSHFNATCIIMSFVKVPSCGKKKFSDGELNS